MNSNVLDIFIPWLGLAAVLWPLLRVQRFIHRHLFGVGFIISRQRGLATLLFYLVLGPGVILHEISRYLVAGMFRIIPTSFSFFPEEQQDGTFDLGFVQFGLIINPVYRAIIDLVPLAVGIAAVIAIGGWALGWTDFITSLRSFDIYVIGDAAQRLVNKPDFWLWSYILFGIANTMMPTRKEARGLWLPIALLVAFLSIFAAFGVWQAVVRLMNGPVANIVYGLTAVFVVVLFINGVAAVLIWGLESTLSAVTRREVQYQAPPSTKTEKTKVRPRTVFDLSLPLPPPPGKPGFKARVLTTLPVPAGEVRPAARPVDEEVTIEKPERPAIGAPTPAPKPAALGAGQPLPGSKPTGVPAAAAPQASPLDEPLGEAAKPKGVFPSPAAPAPLSAPTPAPKPAALKPETGALPAASPALAPSATPAPGPAKPASPFAPKPAPSPGASSNLPALRPTQQPSAAPPKSPAPPPPRPNPLSSPKTAYSADDVIEGEVVEDDAKELKYVDPDEA